LKPAEQSKAVPHPEGTGFALEKEENGSFDGMSEMRGKDSFGLNQELHALRGTMGYPFNGPFQGDALGTNEPGDIRGRGIRMEIKVDRKDAERKKGQKDPNRSGTLPAKEGKKDPAAEGKKKKGNHVLRNRRGKPKTRRNSRRVGEEDRNERKPVDSIHSDPGRTIPPGVGGRRRDAGSGWPPRRSG
jgi:hypothetical protein